MTNRSTQDLLAERRNSLHEMRRADPTTRALIQFGIDQIDRELAKRQTVAAGVIQPPVKTRDAITEVFDATRTTIAQLVADRDARDARELVGLDLDWSPAQVCRRAA